MTETTQGQISAQDERSTDISQKPIASHKSFGHPTLHPATDSASDGDAGERPVREQLKKTSIASIATHGVDSDEAEAGTSMDTVMGSHTNDNEPASQNKTTPADVDLRGRPVRKRSLEDLDSPDVSKEAPDNQQSAASLSGHARKRSRDVRTGEIVKPEARRTSPGTSLREEDEDHQEFNQPAEAEDGPTKPSIEADSPNSKAAIADQEMHDAIQSPRKKRSRDALETESDREQKILATDESRARRRSSEEERQEPPKLDEPQSIPKEQSHENGHAVAPNYSLKESSTSAGQETSTAKIPPTSGFANTSAVSPFAAIAGKSPAKTNTAYDKATTNQQTQTSASAFASSGFAALAGSTTSPFGRLNPTAKTAGARSPPPASTTPFGASALSSVEGDKTQRLGFGGDVKSAFTTGGATPFGGAAGKSTFGGGFGSGFGGGTKLSSFAAPVGDTNIGSVKAKPFGASTTSDDDDSESDDGGASKPEDGSVDQEEESNKVQKLEFDTGEEGEDTIFLNRGKLFQFQGSWVERGLGPFKLNVKRIDPKSEEEEDETTDPKPQARFIMRTYATHRVVLNAPIFKEMDIGDGHGKDPSGKAIFFSVPIDGRLVPHILRMGKEEDIKTLFREVKRLQESM